MIRSALALALCMFLIGCVESQTPPDSDDGDDGTTDGSDDGGDTGDDGGDDGDDGGDDGGGFSIEDAISYRELSSHPGCSTADMTYASGGPDGYQCAGKAYPADGEDVTKPIVLLVHGNSDTPASWERFPAETGMPMIAETLADLGHRVYAVDMRIDLVDDPGSNNETENAARNVDHGWATPLVQHFIGAALEAEPDRRFVLIGFSLGSTIIRDALRRLHLAAADGGVDPWPQLDQVILLAGAHHGVSTFARLCGKNPTMRGQVACELGSRDNYAPTDFLSAINGPDGAYETPCADGDSAFGEAGACGGNTVTYTTVVMRDIADGSYQDEFVSELSSNLDGAENHLLELTDTDESGYFFDGLLRNHYGASRSQAALDIVVGTLEAP